MWLVASWCWIAIVVLYSIWSTVNYTGVFRWVANLQIDRLGGYSEKWTAILPGMILAGPAIWFIQRTGALARAEEGDAPASVVRRLKRARRILCVIGIVASLVATGSWLLSQSVSNGSEPAAPYDISRLGTGPAPKGKVMIRGEAVPDASTRLTIGGLRTEVTIYAGFRPEPVAARRAPVRLFIERTFDDRRDAATAQFFPPEEEGYLVEDGVPEPLLEKLRQRGIPVSSPVYVLRTSAIDTRGAYYFLAGVAAFLGLMFFASAGALTLRARLIRASTRQGS